MIVKSLSVCGLCLGLAAVAPAFTPPSGSAAERFMHFGLVPGFMVKLSQEQARWEASNTPQARARLHALLNTPDHNGQSAACCDGIPPWHKIDLGR